MPQLINWELLSPYNVIVVGLMLAIGGMALCFLFGDDTHGLSTTPLTVV